MQFVPPSAKNDKNVASFMNVFKSLTNVARTQLDEWCKSEDYEYTFWQFEENYNINTWTKWRKIGNFFAIPAVFGLLCMLEFFLFFTVLQTNTFLYLYCTQNNFM